MWNIINVHLLVIVFILSIFGCAKKDSTSESASSTTEVEGTWVTSCFLYGGYYRIYKLEITGTNAKVSYEWHSDSNCSTDEYLYEDTYNSLSLGSEITFNDGTKGKQFTVNVDSFKLTPQTISNTNSLNSATSCGLSNWSKDTAVDYTGLTCGSTAYAQKNTTTYGLYNLVGNNLFLGSLNTTGTYPTEVSTSITYVKQ